MKEIKRAKEELDKISQDKKERRLAELREKAIMDEMAIRDSGYNDGFADGKKDGLEEGIKEGKNEYIKKMLKEKIDLTIISKITGLSIEELKNIK